jgi:AraC family transcriptional activator FtrA
VVALALPGVVLLDLAAPTHLFGHCGAPRYSFELAGLDAGPVPSSTAFDVLAPHGLSRLSRADTVVVPGLALNGNESWREPVGEALRDAFQHGARIMSVCTGAFVLAGAGLLDDRRATTHWASAAELARRYPRVTVDPTVLYVDEGQILTSAGVAAGLDLCLHVIRRDHGARIAAAAARRTVIAPHREGGQAQFLTSPVAPRIPGDRGQSLEPTRQWALEHLEEPLEVRHLAEHACVSGRTFARRFVKETGMTPARWVAEQRVRAAQALLESTDVPVEQVAAHCGFGSAPNLRAHFARRLSITPTAYRRSFAG